MPRGSGLYAQLMEKRRTLEEAITVIDAVIRIVRAGKIGGGRGRVGKPMSEEHKRKLSEAATKRHAQNNALNRTPAKTKAKTQAEIRLHPKPKAINRPRPRSRPKEQTAAVASEA